MIHKACMPVYMNSGKIVADGTGGKIEGSTRGPRGPKKKRRGDAAAIKPLTVKQSVEGGIGKTLWENHYLTTFLDTSLDFLG